MRPDGPRSGRSAWIVGAALAGTLAAAAPAHAQDRSREGILVGPSMQITTTEVQSLGCLAFGAATAVSASVLVYLSPLEALNLPVVAGSFAAGCAVGAVAAPGIHYLYRLLAPPGPPDRPMQRLRYRLSPGEDDGKIEPVSLLTARRPPADARGWLALW